MQPGGALPRRSSAAPARRGAAAPRVPRRAAPRAAAQAPETASTSAPSAAVPLTDVPAWTGASLLSRAVNAAIACPPVFALMKLGARAAIKGTAEGRGVPWGARVAALEAAGAAVALRAVVERPEVSAALPGYYVQPFHGYTEGNLSWQAAYEVEPATAAMALRVWKLETELSPAEAQARLRAGILGAVSAYAAEHRLEPPRDVLDVGCSTGVSTRWLAAEYPAAEVLGLDLSPHFLAVAELREREFEAAAGGALAGGGAAPLPPAAAADAANTDPRAPRRRARYLHANMEATGLPDASFDLVTAQFVIHECPGSAIEALAAEAARLLRRGGGLVALADNDPRSPVIQGLPPPIAALMKSTEPHSDEYYAYDVEAALRRAGFRDVRTVASDPRHRVVLGRL
jgi:ubiquinone/menaquinone biosynthesis C-methylase UbiE